MTRTSLHACCAIVEPTVTMLLQNYVVAKSASQSDTGDLCTLFCTTVGQQLQFN